MRKLYLIILLLTTIIGSQAQVLFDQGKLTPPSSGVIPNFVIIGNWNKTNITYFFSNGTADIAGNDERAAVVQGMLLWSAFTPLTFTEASNAASADIVISWQVGNHGDGSPFDGAPTTGTNLLAHAFAPGAGLGGDVHFDDGDTWTTAQRTVLTSPFDLVTVAAHEIGHALGLDHSTVNCSIMAAAYGASHRYLAPDDIAGIRALYGNRNPILISGRTCSGATLSIPNLGTGPTITWSSNNTGIATVNAAGVVSRTGNGNGTVRITATIILPCGLNYTEFVDIYIGVPPAPGFNTLTNQCIGGSDWELYLQAIPSVSMPPGTKYIWSRNGIDGSPTTTDLYYTYEFPPSCMNIGIKVTNTCGTSAANVVTFCPPCSGFRMAVSPNPATTELNITIDDGESVIKSNKGANVLFTLYGMPAGNPVKTWTMATGQKTYKLSVSGIRKGIYIIKATIGSKTQTEKIIVE